MLNRFENYINGEWVPAASGATFEDRNPADRDDLIGAFPKSDETDARRAAEAAKAAFPAWRDLSGAQRGTFLYKAADLLEKRLDEVARALTREEGKLLWESKGETQRGVVLLRYYANEGMHAIGEVLPSAMNPQTLLITKRVPLGAVGLITPWNFPVAIPIWKAAPALIYGNTVVLKPASLAPYTATLIAEIFHEAGFPAGVFNLVHGPGGSVGNAICTHPDISAISFTGSCEVGGKIAAMCAEHGKKYQLEMGGKNPVLVMEDADLDQAVKLTLSGAMRSAGHKCTATSRAIVVESVADEFTRKLKESAEALKAGPGLEATAMGEGPYLGPVVSEGQRESILQAVESAVRSGAKLVAGGKSLSGGDYDKGHYVAPTVLDEVKPDSTVAQEEVFGPVLAVIRVKDFDEAVRVANNVKFGLSASIFTRDLNKALAAADKLEAGLLRINGETAGVEPQAPFGGMKGSSSGSREQGQAAKEFFTQYKTIYFDRAGG
ncbi:MAG: aldehyde dehydrogenase family protein [Armatimonadetes bacterium]|nr:aldehyde dehydrogenase family protein [Armatimonadota bacterium]